MAQITISVLVVRLGSQAALWSKLAEIAAEIKPRCTGFKNKNFFWKLFDTQRKLDP
jgi:hypothetical protein